MSLGTLQKLVWRDSIAGAQLVELLASNDQLVKILTADYVAYVASANVDAGSEELGLLVTNLLVGDCRDANPAVACSSVAALAAIPSAVDTALESINTTLDNPHPKVRRCSSAACVRYTRTHPNTALDTGLSDQLYSCLRDTDPLVVSNCLLALDQLLVDEGGVVINRPIAHYLLGRLQFFTQSSSLETVLHYLKKYSPRDDKELFDLLNPLDECFKTDNAGVLVAAVELFLLWTAPYPKLKEDLLSVIQPTFCRIFVNSSPEICYLLIDFLSSLGNCIRETFNTHYKYFILNPSDPNFLKEKKMDLIGMLALPTNIIDLISEIHPYCSDYNSYESAIRCLGVLGNVSNEGRMKVYSVLPDLIEASSHKIVAAALECVLTLVSTSANVKREEEKVIVGNKTTASVLDKLGEENTVTSNTCDTGTKEDTVFLPDSVLQSVSKSLACSELSENHTSLVLHLFSGLCSVLECCIPGLEQLQTRQSSLAPATQRLLLSTAARVFITRPAQCYVILCRALQEASCSADDSVRSHAALVYATLQQGTPHATALI